MINRVEGKPFVIRLRPEQKDGLKKLANRCDRSVSATIRRAIDEYIAKRTELLADD